MEKADMEYFSGLRLYGDEFTLEEISRWYELETEGYANKLRKRGEKGNSSDYLYHNLHIHCGFRHLPPALVFEHTLGFGSAFGFEFKPIAHRIKKLTIIEPSELFPSTKVFEIPTTFVKPAVDGTLPFEAGTFDLATCFGVLHHIPNVSKVMAELSRCLRISCYLLVREPVCSQGDWSVPRRSLTKNERGIPWHLFRAIIGKSGFEIVVEYPISFRPFIKCCSTLGLGHPYKWPLGVRLDRLFSKLFIWNYRYHPTGFLQKFTPTAMCYVLRKTR